jgi:hypothetical protein
VNVGQFDPNTGHEDVLFSKPLGIYDFAGSASVAVASDGDVLLALDQSGPFFFSPPTVQRIDCSTGKTTGLFSAPGLQDIALAPGMPTSTPVATNDSYSMYQGTVLVVNVPTGVLKNDTSLSGNPLTARLVSGPANGSLTLNPDGSFRYTPPVTFAGTDSFTYVVSDGSQDSAPATVTLRILEVRPRLLAVVPYNSNPDNDGARQRSMERRVRLVFDLRVFLSNKAVTLTQVPSAARGLTTSSYRGNRTILLQFIGSGQDAANTHFYYDFAVAGNAGRERGGSLEDGRYLLTLNTDLVTTKPGGAGKQLQSDLPGGTTVWRRFHRLFGDVNGDGVVNGVDKSAFDQAYRTHQGLSAYRAIFDIDGNRAIDDKDWAAFKARFNKFRQTLAW